MWPILALIAVIESCDAKGENKSFYDKMKCSNCSRVNEECSITTTGWSCDFGFDAKKLIDNGNSSNIPEALGKCMLPGMQFVKEEPLYGYCCIWSPEIGCQKLMQNMDKEDYCYKCTRATWSPHMVNTSCPCGDWYLGGATSGVMPRPRNIPFIAHKIIIIILNLKVLSNKY